jgi:dihydroxy-acid dehydratase
MIRAQPMDAVVMIGGCDKTVPAQLMAAASADVPAIQLVTGPMMTGSYRGERIGACTDCRRFWGMHRAGEMSAEAIDAAGDQLCPTAGTCMVMGTASTMACVAEALGMMLPGGAAIPAVAAARLRHAEQAGGRAVALADEGLKPSRIMTPAAFGNAFRVLMALGGSTNGLIHMTAVAARLGIRVDLERLDRLGRDTPVLVDLKPSGKHYMEDFENAGGMPTLLREIAPLLDLDCLTVTGATLGSNLERAPAPFPQSVVAPLDAPLYPEGGIAVLRGNLAPDGAIIKQSAASAPLMRHRGRAVVFENLDDLAGRIDDPQLDVEPEDVLVLKNAGPVGAPGMPEAGYLPIPEKLARRGVKDMVRISDARMSGTAFGTVVLHVTPESAAGGPLALVRNGDVIALDVAERSLHLEVADDELARRREEHRGPARANAGRGYLKLYLDHVQQADLGADFDFMIPARDRVTPP